MAIETSISFFIFFSFSFLFFHFDWEIGHSRDTGRIGSKINRGERKKKGKEREKKKNHWWLSRRKLSGK